MAALTKSSAMISLGSLESLRGIADHAVYAIYKKYDYEKGFERRTEMSEESRKQMEFDSNFFIETLGVLKLMEKGKFLPARMESGSRTETIYCSALSLYSGLNHYMKDVKGEALDKLNAAIKAIKNDAKPKDVKAAIDGLKWFGNLAKERTESDYRTYDAVLRPIIYMPSM